MARIKKLKLSGKRERIDDAYKIIGVTTDVSLVKFIFDLNRQLPIKFALNRHYITHEIKGLEIDKPLFVSVENKKEDVVVCIFENRLKIESKNQDELFVTEKWHNVYPVFREVNFFIFIPYGHIFTKETLQKYFRAPYFFYFQPLTIYNFKPFPLFPKIERFL